MWNGVIVMGDLFESRQMAVSTRSSVGRAFDLDHDIQALISPFQTP